VVMAHASVTAIVAATVACERGCRIGQPQVEQDRRAGGVASATAKRALAVLIYAFLRGVRWPTRMVSFGKVIASRR
jgi:hypothetical protein